MHNVIISEGYLISATSNCRSKLQQFKLTIHCLLIYAKTSNKNKQLVSKHGHETRWKTMLRVLPPTLKLVSQLQLGLCKLRESRLLIGELSAPLWAVPNKASLVDLLDVVVFLNQAHFLSQSSSFHFSTIIVDLFGLRDGVRIGDSDQVYGNAHQQQCRLHFG